MKRTNLSRNDQMSKDWDFRPHRTLMPETVLRALSNGDVGDGFNTLSLSNLHVAVPDVESVCVEAAKRCFSSNYSHKREMFVNPHPVSGSIANLAVILALAELGDQIVSFALQSVGHFSLGGVSSLVDRFYKISSLEPFRDKATQDFLHLWQDQSQQFDVSPRLIAFGPTAYPRRIDWRSLRELADSFSPPALLLIDVSHFVGLIAAGLLESPCSYADVVTFTTYKSLCGPPGALILSCSNEIHNRIQEVLIPGLQDYAYRSTLEAIEASLTYCASPAFHTVQKQAIDMAAILAESFVKNGIHLAFGGTDTHLVVVDLAPIKIGATEATELLASHGIFCDPVVLPGDCSNEPHGLRFGTVALAQLGHDDKQLSRLGDQIAAILINRVKGPRRLDQVQERSSVIQKNQLVVDLKSTDNLDEAKLGRPDEFMFRQFRRHSRVLRTPARFDYFMLSGGANLFPMSSVWKDLLQLEIASDMAYGWYTSQEGFPTLQRAVSMWENYAASKGLFPTEKPLGSHVCITLGATQAVTAIFDYVAHSCRHKSVLFVGLNYALFERLARHYAFKIYELLNDDVKSLRTLPTAEQVTSFMRATRPAIVVVVTPNNPSGEQYNADEIAHILYEATNIGSLVLFDQVGQMLIAQDSWVNIGEVIVQTGSQDQIAVVNSFSKSDGVPGFRLGYLLGPERIASHAAQYQLIATMNPPTVPVLPPFFSLLARCVHVGERLGWLISCGREPLLSFAWHMFEVTTAVAPSDVLNEMGKCLSSRGFECTYGRYCHFQAEVGRAIRENHAYVFERLGKFISRATDLQGGFNFLIEFEPFSGKDEDAVCEQLFDETAVAILTESCFRVSPRQRKNFWVRMSLAAPTENFRSAVDRFADFLENM